MTIRLLDRTSASWRDCILRDKHIQKGYLGNRKQQLIGGAAIMF